MQDSDAGRRTPTTTRHAHGARRPRTSPLRTRALKRIFILAVIMALVVSYAGPIRGYRAKRADLRSQQIALRALITERDGLRQELRQIQKPAVMEARARELGFMKRGEVQYRITGSDGAGGADELWGRVSLGG